MQQDMHFYGTYAIARVAGFTPEQARTVATAAEYVDESINDGQPIQLGNLQYLLPQVTAHAMLDKDNFNRIDQWRVWVPFHFLPGGGGHHVDERVICLWGEPGNPAADAVIELALKAGANKEHYALHLLGIVTHVIQDTYAHYGFSGFASHLNRIDQDSLSYYDVETISGHLDSQRESFFDRLTGFFAEATELGHAAVATYPDRPYLHWGFDYEDGPLPEVSYLHERRSNPETFYLACTRLHAIYSAYLEGKDSMYGLQDYLPFSDNDERVIKEVIEREGEMAARCNYWKDVCREGALFRPAPGDTDLNYNDRGWTIEAMLGNSLAATTDAARFHAAASAYLHEVLGHILPSMGILA